MKRTLIIAMALALLTACGAGDRPHAGPNPTPTTASPATPTPSPTPRPSTPKPSPRPTPTRKPVAPKPSSPPKVADVFVLCDSVLLSAGDELRSVLAPRRVTIDRLGSRRLPQGITVLRARRAEIGPVAVIHLGNNYIASEGDFGDQIDRAMRVLRGVRRVVWVTVAERWPSRVEINREIRRAASRWPSIRIADWATVIAAHPGYAGDMLHLSPSGRWAIARLIAKAVDSP